MEVIFLSERNLEVLDYAYATNDFEIILGNSAVNILAEVDTNISGSG